MSAHTPEPWEVVFDREDGSYWPTAIQTLSTDENGLHEIIVRDGWDDDFGNDQVANARRIVACVNACAGIPNDLLEQHPAAISEVYAQSIIATEAELTALRQQVADLRAALEDRAFIAHYQGDESEHNRTPWHDCRAVGCQRADRVLAATQPQEVQS